MFFVLMSFLPSGRKGKIASSSNDLSYQNKALTLGKWKGEETFPNVKELDYLTCSHRALKAIIIGYAMRPYDVPREVLRSPCSLSFPFRGLSFLLHIAFFSYGS